MANVYGNANSNARVYFMNGSLGTQQASQNLQNFTSGTMPISPQPQVLYQAATLPSGNLPSHYGNLPSHYAQPITGLARTVVDQQGSKGVQTAPQPQVVPYKILGQPPVTRVSTSCAPCAARAASMSPPVVQYVQVAAPNGVQGWYGGMQAGRPQSPMVRTSDVIRYPTVDAGQNAQAQSPNDSVEKMQEVKLQAARGANQSEVSSLSPALREVRNIGTVLALIGSLTVGLGIAGVVIYHNGRATDSGLAWCREAHSVNNSLTYSVLKASPGINYVTSGAGILGLLTFIVGAMTMNLESDRGTLPITTMYLSIFDLPVLVLMAILSILSFSMTFRNDGAPPTCVSLSVVTFLTFIMALLPFVLLFVIYCKMRLYQYNSAYQRQEDFSYSPGGNGVYPVSKISVVRVGASNAGVQRCYCECCPCCLPTTQCCTCVPHDQEMAMEEQPTNQGPPTTTTQTAPATQQNAGGFAEQAPMATPFSGYPYGRVAFYGGAAVRPNQFAYLRY